MSLFGNAKQHGDFLVESLKDAAMGVGKTSEFREKIMLNWNGVHQQMDSWLKAQ